MSEVTSEEAVDPRSGAKREAGLRAQFFRCLSYSLPPPVEDFACGRYLVNK